MTSPVITHKVKIEENGGGGGGGDGDGGALLQTPPDFNNSRSNSNITPPTVEETLPTTRKSGRQPAKQTAPARACNRIPLPPVLKPITTCAEPTVEMIKAKYGDIEKDCDLKSEVMRKMVVSGICSVLKELHTLKIEELNVGSLDKYYDVVKDAEKLKIDVKWLRQQLDRLKEAIDLNMTAKVLLAERYEQKNKLIRQQEELIALDSKKQKTYKRNGTDSCENRVFG